MKTKWQRIKYLPCVPLGPDGRRATASKEHIAISRKAATEGMVLLKNENNLLPLKPSVRVALFGKASADYVKGGGGSGDVIVDYVHNLCDAMETYEKANRLTVFTPLLDFYRKNVRLQYEAGVKPGYTTEPELPDDLLMAAKARCDVAIISICRFSSEGWDRKGEPNDGDFYLSKEEAAMVEKVTKVFDHTVIVLNVSGMVDSTWFKDNSKIEAVLLAYQGGMEGADAEADLLLGTVTPSGKLVDTFASSFDDYPSSYNFNESEDYVEYTDDIYVGYRYFETIPSAKEKVNYPFGYGLSYTSFDVYTTDTYLENDEVVVCVNVENTGKYSGKEVIQVYFSAPQGKLGKPARQLVAFKKTDLLSPNENRDYILRFPVKNMASFDDEGLISKASWVLEAGEYSIYVGTSVENANVVYTYVLDTDTVTEKLHSYCTPKKLTKRMQADGTYVPMKTGEYEKLLDTSDWPEKETWDVSPNYVFKDPRDLGLKEGVISLEMVMNGEHTMDELLDQLTMEEIISLVGGRPNNGVSNTWGWGDLPNHGIPNALTADGPAGVRYFPEVGITATAFPCQTLLACTWNEEMVYEIGRVGGLELKESNLAVWLTPALNIHRSPLCGRNFEYYSEDPLVSGKMASALTRGIQSNNVGACAKHFCCNNKETNRVYADSRVSERALREIYLKGFEICVKEAHPWSIMTSYNQMNGRFTSENKELISGILRSEWGFDGLVTTDWSNRAEHYRELLAGNDVRMAHASRGRLYKALELGLIKREDFYPSCKKVLELLLKID